MHKLQIKEEIMAVAALLALGTLTVLAGGLNTKVTTVVQPKAMFGACMGSMYVASGSIDRYTAMACAGVSIGLGGVIDTASKDWWQKQLGGQRLSVVLGTRILNALRLARFASWGAGPLGFFVMTA